MELRKVQTILNKAEQDPKFAASLQTNLRTAVAPYKLSKEELNAVSSGLSKLISHGVVLDNGSGMRTKE